MNGCSFLMNTSIEMFQFLGATALSAFSVDSCCRSSRPEVFCKRGVLRNFAKFTGKHLCQSIYFNKEALAQLFSFDFSKFLNTFSYRTSPVAASAADDTAYQILTQSKDV